MRTVAVKIGIVLLLLVPGCEIVKDGGQKIVRIDPNQAAKVEGAAEATIGILEALTAIWPVAGIGVAGLGTALAAWRKAKKNLTEKQSESQMYYNATAALVEAIGDYRDANPDKWAKLKKQLEDAIGPEAENVIRAIRGLEPKK